MKSILVPIGGADSDEAVFETALAAARPLVAHLNFMHVYIGAGRAAKNVPHVDFASGPGLSQALDVLEREAESRSATAARHVRDFCQRADVAICDAPVSSSQVTASCREEKGDALSCLMFHARHHDLIVVGRSSRPNGLPSDFVERLLLGCGRPVLIAGANPARSLTGSVMVCWRESADAARAVTAATPLLRQARRVIFTTVAQSDDGAAGALQEITAQFAWNGVPAEAKLITRDGRKPEQLLADAAAAEGVDLVVMGAYGHSHMREVLFGGCTQAFIRHADRPVLLMH
jgi:nucleotide-binding universal stress UspA family protein